mgnify:CR=1 FL=1
MKASAGTYESSDCLVTIQQHDTLQINIESIVFDQFGEQIELVIKQTLNKHNIDNIKVDIFDKGALDYTVIARVETALKRGGYIE